MDKEGMDKLEKAMDIIADVVGIDRSAEISITLPLKDWFDVMTSLTLTDTKEVHDKINEQAKAKSKVLANAVMKKRREEKNESPETHKGGGIEGVSHSRN